MKLNKLFFIALIIAILAGFTACGSDDDDYSANDIAGTWGMTLLVFDVETNNAEADLLLKTFYDSKTEGVDWTLSFESGGTYISRSNDPDFNENGTYRVKGNRLYMKATGETEEDVIIIDYLSKNKLTFREDVKTMVQEDMEDIESLPGNLTIKKAIMKLVFLPVVKN